MKITILGQPIPWKRPAGRFHRYDEQKSDKEKVRIQMMGALSRMPHHDLDFPYNEALFIKVDFYIAPPSTDSPALCNAKLWGIETAHQKPDVDNLLKFILDSGNGLLWADDKRIQEAHISKCYSENPRTEITIMKVEKLDLPDSVAEVLKVFGPDKLRKFGDYVQGFQFMVGEDFEDNLEKSKGDLEKSWLAWITVLLVRFARENADDLKKISKFKNIEKECKDKGYNLL